jgi:ergothioneine biosynthesis protein EgtB
MRIAKTHASPVLQPHTRGAIEARFNRIRKVSEQLAEPLSDEDCNVQSMPDASPTKWHLAHTSWFFETFVLERFARDFKPFHPAFRVLFNSYYNGIGDKHPRHERGLISRPDLATVRVYRQHVTAHVQKLFSDCRDTDFWALVELGCHHEEQHQELVLTDLKHLFSRNPLQPAYQAQWPLTAVAKRHPQWFHYDGGLIEIGHRGPGFSFDNEAPRHRVFVHPFALASHPVSHGEFAEFVEDNGYTRADLWLSLGWDWVQANHIDAPLYWQQRDGVWSTFTVHGRVEIDADTPMCHVSFFEADAYARWKGARLPTEFEWELAATDIRVDGNFMESRALHPLSCRAPARGSAPAQLFGDVWEWTNSQYLPYPGYAAAAGAVGEYNGKFMCNQFVLRGGSCATPRDHMRASYRNFFPPEARWQFSGLRLAKNGD